MRQKKLVYLDTDLGLGTPRAELDDAAALIALHQSSIVQLMGAGSTFGNVPIHDATMNLFRAVSMLSMDIRLGRGADHPLEAEMNWFHDWQRGYGKTIDWFVPEDVPDAADLMIDCVKAHPHQVTILAIGPLTNLASAVIKAPEIIPLVEKIVVMGGSFGIQTVSPEFNFRCDPEAANILLSTRIPVTMLGLNITRQVHFTRKEISSLLEWNPYISLLKDQVPAWIERVENMGWDKGGCSLHDAVAAAYVIDPSLFSIASTAVTIELLDPALRGLTRFSNASDMYSNKRIVTNLNVQLVHQLILRALNHQEVI